MANYVMGEFDSRDSWTVKTLEDVPTEEELIAVNALFHAVYKWDFEKIGKMKLDTIEKWIENAKKRMTWQDAMRLRKLLGFKPKKEKKSLWQKIKNLIS
jgi:hypothetical protein